MVVYSQSSGINIKLRFWRQQKNRPSFLRNRWPSQSVSTLALKLCSRARVSASQSSVITVELLCTITFVPSIEKSKKNTSILTGKSLVTSQSTGLRDLMTTQTQTMTTTTQGTPAATARTIPLPTPLQAAAKAKIGGVMML